MRPRKDKLLLLGYGNPGRRDDGLGPALVDAAASLGRDDLTVDADYQLTVEDAAQVAAHPYVLFVDAALEGPEPFSLRRIEPADKKAGFSTHSLDPRSVLALARDLFDARPEAYLLGIRGYAFDAFGEGLTPKAKRNLEAALEFLKQALSRGSFREGPAEANGPGRNGRQSSEGEPCETAST
jgi:hydrogenase maturation protease